MRIIDAWRDTPFDRSIDRLADEALKRRLAAGRAEKRLAEFEQALANARENYLQHPSLNGAGAFDVTYQADQTDRAHQWAMMEIKLSAECATALSHARLCRRKYRLERAKAAILMVLSTVIGVHAVIMVL